MGTYHEYNDNHIITPEDAGQLIQDARADGYKGDIIIIINGEYYEITGGRNNG